MGLRHGSWGIGDGAGSACAAPRGWRTSPPRTGLDQGCQSDHGIPACLKATPRLRRLPTKNRSGVAAV